MRDKLITLCLFLLLCCLSATSFAQTEINFNLPPGAKLTKKIKLIDYSFKLDESHNEPLTKNYLAKFKANELESIKSIDYPKYKYYTDANAYFMALSNRVKRAFTVDELWYIYMFDKNLKDKLPTIK